LMDGRKLNSTIMRYNRFRPVAVMSIKIPNCNAFSAGFQRVERSDGNIAKITETHRAIFSGMMPGRSHQAKRGFAVQRRARSFNGGASRMTRVRFDVRIKRCIEIEIFPPISDAFEMLTRMRAQQFVVRRSTWSLPLPFRVPILQHRYSSRDPLRPFRMTRPGIFETTRIVKNSHRACKLSVQHIFDYDQVITGLSC